MKIIVMLLISAAAIGLFLTAIELLASWLHLRRRRPFAPRLREQAGTDSSSFRQGASTLRPVVSILKPLCGADDGLATNLACFAALDGSRYEVIFSIADENDPAVAVVKELIALNPSKNLRLVHGHRDWDISNPKVERLIAAMAHARGEIIMISDAQVRATEADLEGALALLRDRSIGCVSHLFVGNGARNLGAVIESAHLLSFVAAGNALAAMARVPCVVGKSMMIPRHALDRIGGFAAFSKVLAEDQAIALALKRVGYRVALAPSVVSNFVERKSVSAAISRQVRWNKIRYSFSKAAYSTEFLINPTPLALIAVAASFVSGTFVVPAMIALAVTVVIRSLYAAALASLLHADRRMLITFMMPLQDLLQFGAQFVPFLSNEVNWRGNRARLGHGTEILPIRAESIA